MRVIRDDLHCTAVRITGGDPGRLEIAAKHAADAGLEVWFSPFTNGLTQDALLDLLADCAERAERLRQSGAEVALRHRRDRRRLSHERERSPIPREHPRLCCSGSVA